MALATAKSTITTAIGRAACSRAGESETFSALGGAALDGELTKRSPPRASEFVAFGPGFFVSRIAIRDI